jgi:hypothetical protein
MMIGRLLFHNRRRGSVWYVRRLMDNGFHCESRGDGLLLCLYDDALGDGLVAGAPGLAEPDMLLLLKDGQLLIR